MAKNNNEGFNINDYKSEIDKYIKERVEKEASSESIKYYKRRLGSKTATIIIEFIIILCLLCLSGVECYLLYQEGYFNKYETAIKKNEKPVNTETNTETNTEEKNKLNELVNKYSYLVDNIIIDTKCDYLSEYYGGNLTNELKEYLSFQIINKDYITNDESSSYFDSELLRRAYRELFADNLTFTDFKVNGANYKFLNNKEMFISTSLSTKGHKIIKEITNIEEKDYKVIITTTEGYIKDNKLYNVLSNKEITDYKKDEKISKYSKKLNTVKYTFNNEILESIK